MLGSFIGKYKDCLTDERGAVVVSFTVEGSERYAARQCAAAAQTALASGKERLKIEVNIDKPKRSLNANNYLWQLCDKIAAKVGSSKLDIYRGYVLEQGVFEAMAINAAAVKLFSEVWGARGDGWLVEIMDGAERDGYVLLHAYKGSSTYDKEQMARLIDSVVTDAKELEIETRTPEEIELMKQRWEGSRL